MYCGLIHICFMLHLNLMLLLNSCLTRSSRANTQCECSLLSCLGSHISLKIAYYKCMHGNIMGNGLVLMIIFYSTCQVPELFDA
jgi:hypothetical protein